MSQSTYYKCGYCGWTINKHCDDYLEHICFAQRIQPGIECQLLADDNNVLTLSMNEAEDEANTSAVGGIPDEAPVKTIEELLITEVMKRPPLWDHTTPTSQRHKLKLKDLWQEIYNTLEKQYPIEELKKKWRQLRDEYVRAKRKQKGYIPSGSGGRAQAPKSGFHYYDMMKFLDDTLEQSPTESNVILTPSTSTGGPSSTGSETPTAKDPRKNKNKQGDLQEALLQARRQPEQSLDGVDGFLMMAGEGLRRLPYCNRVAVEIKILQMIQEEEEKINQN